MANSWMIIAVKVADKQPNFIFKKLTDSTLGNIASGTLLGGNLRIRRFWQEARDIIGAIAQGVYHGNVWTSVFSGDGAFPAGNIACLVATATGKTVTFTFGTLAIVFTEGAAGAQGFARGATNSTLAIALAAAINAHPVLGGVVKATVSTANVVLAGKIPTGLLHHIVISTNDGTAFVLTQLTGGVPGTATLFPQNVAANKTPV